MLRRMGIGEFIGILHDAVEKRTGIKCVSNPEGEESPFFSIQIVGTEPKNTKTSFIDRYEVWVHCISESVVPYSDAPVLDMVQALEEALTDDVELPDPFDMAMQEHLGLQAVKQDESGEGHAVVGYAFRIQYGLKCK